MAINPVTGVEEDYLIGSSWTYNDFIKRIEDHHHAPIDSIGASLPNAAGLPNGYAHYNTVNGEYYVNYSSVFRNFSAISYNWNVMVGRGGLSGRAFIKNSNGYFELRTTANNAFIGAATIDGFNIAKIKTNNPHWISAGNLNSTLGLNQQCLQGHVAGVSNGGFTFNAGVLTVPFAGLYVVDFAITLLINDISRNIRFDINTSGNDFCIYTYKGVQEFITLNIHAEFVLPAGGTISVIKTNDVKVANTAHQNCVFSAKMASPYLIGG
jgi:hypothetical protein